MKFSKKFIGKFSFSDVVVSLIATGIATGLGKIAEFVGIGKIIGSFSAPQIVLIFILVFISVYISKSKISLEDKEKAIYDKMGISDYIAQTKNGKGGTKSILKKCENTFSFMGSGGRKWTNNRDELEKALVKISGNGGEARFILLNPMSGEVKTMEGRKKNEERKGILHSIKVLKELQDAHKGTLNLRLKVYSYERVFRIVISDEKNADGRNEKKIYLGSYELNGDNAKRPQLVLSEGKILYKQFERYYEVTWDSKNLKEVDFSRLTYDDLNYPDKSSYWEEFICP